MKTLSLMILAASLSSTATFIYTTKKMDPELYQMITSGAKLAVNQLKQNGGRSIASDCSSASSDRGPASVSGTPQPSMKELLKKAQEAQQQRKEFFKEMENAQ